MLPRFARGKFHPKNAEKYVGLSTPTYRSSWEHAFMQFCDKHTSVVKWASESVRIPYKHPLTGKQTNYVPDFLVQYEDKRGKLVTELVEIKPKKQSVIESKASNKEKAVVAVNYAKWASAQVWCKRNGITFRVITEDDIFRQGGNKKKR